MKILAFSDVHCDLTVCAALVQAGAQADLVIGAGDFAQRHMGLEETLEALEPLAAKAIYVPGNNETADALRACTGAVVLHGERASVSGLEIVGIGGAVPPLPPLPWGSFDLEEDDAAAMLAPFSRADILISHSPPRDTVDMLAPEGLLGMHGAIGSRAVRAAALRMRPALVLCGHVHDSWGKRARLGDCQVANLGPQVNWFELGDEDGGN